MSSHSVRLAAALTLSFSAAVASAQNLVYSQGDFAAADWNLITLTDEGPASLTMQIVDDGGGNPGMYWLINYLVPQSTEASNSLDRLAAIYTGQAYDPAVSGALEALAFSADVRALSNSFSFAQFGYLRPAIMQDGVVYTYLSSDFAPTAPGAFGPQSWSFAADASWVTAVTGSADHPDFSATGAPIYAGFRFAHNTQCTSATGCRGGSTFVGVDNFAVALTAAAPVPEPRTGLLLCAGLLAGGLMARRRAA